MTYRAVFYLILFMAFSATLSEAFADIGEIGSPVVPSNAPKQHKGAGNNATNNNTTPITGNNNSKPAPTPILVIDFSQKHVYYDRELKQAIDGMEGSQAGSTYKVVSQVPPTNDSGKMKTERMNESFDENTNGVVQKLQDMGIPQARIHTSTETSDDVTSQQIEIFAE